MDVNKRAVQRNGLGRPGTPGRRRFLVLTGGLAGLAMVPSITAPTARAQAVSPRHGRAWLAGDHHIHSEFSVGYGNEVPPVPKIGGDGRYAIATNARIGRQYGLDWMVSTDHGGPNHSKINLERAYPSLLASRDALPELLQFFGMEFDTPAADHSSLIIPRSANEAQVLFDLESTYSKRDAFPLDPERDTEVKMIEALNVMKALDLPPVLFANHAARSAPGLGVYGLDTPQEFRNWNDFAPGVAVGMEGAPGHQAGALQPDGTLGATRPRGEYGQYPTMGGFDQMAARLGGLWDALLGEGRRWWITATSDSHVNYRDGGVDFWPGEYAKTYVYAEKSYTDVLDGLRGGRMFVVTGDLVDRLDLWVRPVAAGATHGDAPDNAAGMGETLTLHGEGRQDVTVEIRFRHPAGPNPRGERPRVSRLDLIMGQVVGRAMDRALDRNPTTTVVARFGERDWQREGDLLVVRHTLEDVRQDAYIRVRGTNTSELEPGTDAVGDDPWADLWVYSNPVFLRRR